MNQPHKKVTLDQSVMVTTSYSKTKVEQGPQYTTAEKLNFLYPVNSLYITCSKSTTCPLAAHMKGSQWELVKSNLCLQGTSSYGKAGKTIEAGVPNVSGRMMRIDYVGKNDPYYSFYGTTNGCFVASDPNVTYRFGGGGHNYNSYKIMFDASRSSKIYGKSNTVQPAAYVVNVWKRIA